MKLAIMQPYLFPYIGYFQLLREVDAFVVFDDVNFIKGGWINRNSILVQNKKKRITLPLQGGSPNKLINQVLTGGKNGKFLKTIQQEYSKAPQFSSVFAMIEEIVSNEETNLAHFLYDSLRRLSEYLDLHPKWYVSSSLKKNNSLRGQSKVIAICEELGATHYINLPGGKTLYDKAIFSKCGLKLSFIQPKPISYTQFGDEFVPNLSIIDVLMFNDLAQCSHMLCEYDLV
jgi:hypothetical protein